MNDMYDALEKYMNNPLTRYETFVTFHNEPLIGFRELSYETHEDYVKRQEQKYIGHIGLIVAKLDY